MYQKAGAGFATGGLSGLAYTGMSVLWLVLAGFALIAAGAAVARVAPRFHRSRDEAGPHRSVETIKRAR